MGSFVFVYAKEGKIKALNLKEGMKQHDDLVRDGWIHTKTLNGHAFIENLHNDCESIVESVMSLSKIE